MASPTWWTWVWVNSGNLWWTRKPGVLRFMGLQRVGDAWETELSWTQEGRIYKLLLGLGERWKIRNTEEKIIKDDRLFLISNNVLYLVYFKMIFISFYTCTTLMVFHCLMFIDSLRYARHWAVAELLMISCLVSIATVLFLFSPVHFPTLLTWTQLCWFFPLS